MVYGGVPDVLVTNEIVGRQKLRRLMALAGMRPDRRLRRRPGAGRAISTPPRREAGIDLPVYVEVNMGGNRCGVEPGEPALDLARRIVRRAASAPSAGLQAYHGSAQHLRGWDERQQAIAGAADKAG